MKNLIISVAVASMMAVSACSTSQVADNTGAAAGFVTKTAVKGTVAVGKAAYKGVKTVAAAD